jgi:hypothetical protein
VKAFDDVREKFGLTGRPTFVPCSGAITDDVFELRAGRPVPQYLEATDVGKGPTKWDVVSFTFGGNNLKFSDVLIGCLNEFDDWTRGDATPGCNQDQATLEGRVDQLLGKPGATGADLQGSVNIPALLDRVTDLVKPGGQIIMVGYPRLFVASKLRSLFGVPDYPACSGVLGADTNMLNSVVDRLNKGLKKAVEDDAASRHKDKDVRFTFVDAAKSVDGHELCSEKPWLNGRISTGLDYISWYHPNQQGHDAIAAAVASAVDLSERSALDLRAVDWKKVTVPASFCPTTADVDLGGPTLAGDDGYNGENARLKDRGYPTAVRNDLAFAEGQPVVYGDLFGDGSEVAGISITCYVGVSSVHQQGFLIVDGRSGSIEHVGGITARYKGEGYHPLVSELKIESGKITATEQYYRSEDSHGGPSGHARTEWDFRDGKLTPGRTTIVD